VTKDKVSNVAASVRQRLLNIIHETGDDANLVWTRYATERLPGQRPSPRAGVPAVPGCLRNPRKKKNDDLEDDKQDWGKFSVVLRRTL
jgi:hypothetical protein